MTTPTTTKLTRSRHNRMLGGVCAGLAHRVGWKPRTMRLAFIVSCLLPGPQFLLYLVLWIVIPVGDR
ncbi:phage shock protein C (PspC) family protein [Prauserella aidingensis]|uniref:PspC domain-containing protein n=1 Tax=Prauserella aidingensis TaxID=387890 RepID=UPI0020A5993B|nr:PspC domain-containing protein [Prauserella aidingensis]MCP2254596.1 phage shock protein C (PspC) family protein [Prauserella aidingensis]